MLTALETSKTTDFELECYAASDDALPRSRVKSPGEEPQPPCDRGLMERATRFELATFSLATRRSSH